MRLANLYLLPVRLDHYSTDGRVRTHFRKDRSAGRTRVTRGFRLSVAMAERKHPFPSRTRKLSSPAPMVLRGYPRGRVGRRRINLQALAPETEQGLFVGTVLCTDLAGPQRVRSHTTGVDEPAGDLRTVPMPPVRRLGRTAKCSQSHNGRGKDRRRSQDRPEA